MRVSDGTGAGSNHPADPESKIITESEVSIEQSRRHVLGIAVTHLSQEPISKRKTQRRYRLTVGATVLFVLVLVLSTAIALLLAPRFKTLPKPNDENSNLEEDGGPASPSNPKLDIEDLRTLCFDGARSFDLTQVSEYLLRERDEFADTLYAIGLKVLQYESMTCFSQNLALLWLAANPPLQVTEQILVNRYVLATIYIALGGWEWARGKDWLQNADHCSWNGIMCNHLGEIVKIHLPKNNMQGQLPEEIGYLSALTSLDVEMNKLTGPLPPTLANLHNLVELDISFNRFTGTISESLFQMTQLEILDLARFGGTLASIPSTVGKLLALTRLLAPGTDLGGTIPTSIGRCSSLRFLDLSKNNIEGPLPSELGSLDMLQTLYLSNNAGVEEFDAPDNLCDQLVSNDGNLLAFDLHSKCKRSDSNAV